MKIVMSKKMFIEEIVKNFNFLSTFVKIQLVAIVFILIIGFLVKEIWIMDNGFEILYFLQISSALCIVLACYYCMPRLVWFWKLRKTPSKIECVAQMEANGIRFLYPSGLSVFVNASIYEIIERRKVWIIKNKIAPIFVIKKSHISQEWMDHARKCVGPPPL